MLDTVRSDEQAAPIAELPDTPIVTLLYMIQTVIKLGGVLTKYFIAGIKHLVAHSGASKSDKGSH